MPGEVKRQTIKQAKKSFKDRGQPSLSDRELKQLQRAQELEQRAWKTKEQEKRRAEVVKKRADKEKGERLERERAQLGSQRRRDRFGYQSSQFHLGKFFKAGGVEQATVPPKETGVDPGPETQLESGIDTSEEDFFEDDFDESTILDVLEQSASQTGVNINIGSASKSVTSMPPPSVIPSKRRGSAEPDVIAPTVSVAPPSPLVVNMRDSLPSMTDRSEYDTDLVDEDLGSFWDELDSSTQIARDLDTPQLTESKSSLSRSSSFGLDDMDLTEEDLERLDPLKPVLPVKDDRMLMPPPLLPPQRALPAPRHTAATKSSHQPVVFQPKTGRTPLQDRWRPCSTEHGFTTSDLESWIDEDIVLTQVAPG